MDNNISRFKAMSNIIQFKRWSPVAIGFTIFCLMAGCVYFKDVQEQRTQELQKNVSELELETNGSQGNLSKDEFLSLKKDIATLKKESFVSQDSAWLVLFQTLGTVGIVGGLLVTWNGQSMERENSKKEFEAANERLVSERFFNAVELLGHNNRSSRLGGIYTLESIATHCSDYKKRTIEILAAYIKDTSACLVQINPQQQEKTGDTPTNLDIKIALEVIHKVRKDLLYNSELPMLDLNHTNLRELDFPLDSKRERLQMEHCYLNKVGFRESNLTSSCFSQSTLIGVKFGAATLDYASFRESTLEQVEFEGASLKGVNFKGAKLEGVDFRKVKSLKGVIFKDANLQGIIFKESHREEADFSEVNLSGTTFENADLEDVTFNEKIPRKKMMFADTKSGRH